MLRKYSIQADLSSIDGHVRTPGSFYSLWLAFDRISQYDAQLQPQPMLAEELGISVPTTSRSSSISRQGVTYHSVA